MAVVVALLRASHDELPKVSKGFGGESSRVKSTIDRLNRVIQVLEGGDWVGEGATAFYKEMHSEVMPALQRLMKALEMGANVSDKIGRLIDELEQDCTSFLGAVLASFEGGALAGGIVVGEMAGIGGQAEAAGGSGGGASAATSEKPSSGGGGGGAGGGAGGGGSGGGGGSWDGEIGFKQGKPPTKPGKR